MVTDKSVSSISLSHTENNGMVEGSPIKGLPIWSILQAHNAST
jgi:hypothetical protein